MTVAAAGELHGHAFRAPVHGARPGPGAHIDPLAGQRATQARRGLVLLAGQDPPGGLQQRHRAAQPGEALPQLAAHRAGAEHHQRSRQFGEVPDGVAGQRGGRAEPGQVRHHRVGARGDHGAPEGQRPPGVEHRTARSDETGAGRAHIHAVGGQGRGGVDRGDPRAGPVDVAHDRGEVHPRLTGVDAEPGAVASRLGVRGGGQEGLRGGRTRSRGSHRRGGRARPAPPGHRGGPRYAPRRSPRCRRRSPAGRRCAARALRPGHDVGMPPRDDRPVDVSGIVLPDARSGEPVELESLPGVTVLTAIRHRY